MARIFPMPICRKALKPLRLAVALILIFGPTLPAFAQTTKLPFSQSSNTSNTSAQQQQDADPLGRNTPRGTVTGFIKAVHRDDYVSAARYMQVSNREAPQTKTLARRLKELMDRYFSQPLTMISNSPAGMLEDGLPLDQERVGPLTIDGDKFDIILVRVNNPQFGLIWIISSDTLAHVPALYDAMEKPWIERTMPDVLLNHGVLGISAAQLILWAASIAIPIVMFWLMGQTSVFLVKKFVKGRSALATAESWYESAHWPVILLLALNVHLGSITLLGFSLTWRIVYARVAAILIVVVFTWLLRRISTLAVQSVRRSMERRGHTGTETLVLLGERLFKVFIAVLAIFAILAIVGVDTKTALAGLGIGGVAVAFGAQKTVENLFGGIFLLSDQALAIGDTCCISNRIGTVEDITLRSVRLRTQEQTLLSVPAGALAQANIENLATRSKILMQTTLQLRYGTTVEQIRAIIDGITKLLADSPKVESQTARIRLVNFGVRAIELELFAYILTPDNMKFLAVREGLLLSIATIVETAGSGFAVPTQFVYLENQKTADGGIHELDSLEDVQVAKNRRGNRRAS